MKSALIILADGFESIEAITVMDILRRGRVDLVSAGVGKKSIKSARQIEVRTDFELAEVKDKSFDAIIIPGGEPGTTHLQENKTVKAMLDRHAKEGKVIGAICAAPRILDELGIISGKKATSYPAYKENCLSSDYQELSVVVDGNIVTSRGPGTAMIFAYTILEQLSGSEIPSQLKKAMLFEA